MAEFKDLIGKTLTEVSLHDDSIIFITSDGERYRMYHHQDCCESVGIDDINGDLQDLIGSPILEAEERTNIEASRKDDYDESFTWTFYTIGNVKAHVTIKWYGTSNGYYSESVDFDKI